MLHVLPLLPLSLVTSTFLPSSSPALMVPAARRSATAAVRLDLGGDRRIFEEERIESIKAGVCSSTAGSVASAPCALPLVAQCSEHLCERRRNDPAVLVAAA